ncbi:MAG: penicillin acylase family protein, partial [Minicystis sp.]
LMRRKARGTSAELLGKKALKADLGARVLKFGSLGEADFARTKNEHQADIALVEAWVRGVNLRIQEVSEGKAQRPYGFGAAELDFLPAPWTPGDTFAIAKLLAFGLSSTLDAEILATAILRLAPQAAEHLPLLMPAYDSYITLDGAPKKKSGKPATLPGQKPPMPAPFALPEGFHYDPVFPNFASNNWAITAEHSKNGKPLLAGDPHQPTSSPQRLWPVHMSSTEGGGALDVIGFSFVGTPAVQLGHNAHVGWTATTNFADVMDLYDVPAGGTWKTVKLGGEPHAIETRKESILVRPEGGGAPEEQVFDLHEVPGYGVFLPDEMLPLPAAFLADGAILFNWTGFSPTVEASSYLGFDRAQSLDEFVAAADTLSVGALNLVAADAKDIVYHVHARVPDRGDPSARPMPWHVISGQDPMALWPNLPDLPASKLPQLKNPTRGFICSGNNDPFGFTADGSVENDPYYYGSFYATGFRPHRMEEVLTPLLAQRKLDRADMEELQRDTHSPMADTLLPHLAKAMAAVGSDPALKDYVGRDDLKKLSTRLAAWDRRFDKAKSEPVIFLGLQWFSVRRTFANKLTVPLFAAVQSKSPPYLPGQLRNVLEGRFADAAYFLPDGENALLLRALDDTAAWLTQRFGSLDAVFALQDIHGCAFPNDWGDALVRPNARVNGSLDTINVSQAGFFDDKGQPLEELSSHETSLYRMVVAFGDDGTPEATFDFALGASGEPGSPHYDDATATWLDAQHVPLPFRKADVEARTQERVVLAPAP